MTPREREVMQYVAQGCSNPSIAESLNVSTAAVKKTLTSAFGKLGVNNRFEAARHFVAQYGDDGQESM
ncbi:hypothetical protein C4J81_00570 [Deltaproteobacteria bacterium Smac51]|nr:hypothetical protein C4J81_00570 [Deltaproteobacteria bacterium Smac51]